MLTYAEYYNLAQNKFNKETPKQQLLNLYNLTMKNYHPHQENEFFTFPKNYSDLIDSLSKKIDNKVNNESERYHDPSHTGYDLAIQIKDVWDMPELNEIASHILPQLERTVFNSYIHLSAVHAYRNVQTEQQRRSSWLWHYDNNPKEAVKILIYLTDVEENNGPFELFKHPENGKIPKIETSRTGYNHWLPAYVPGSRIPPEMINELKTKNGLVQEKITGPKGTVLFFDNNIVHRANIPTEGYRDCVILNIRPCIEKIRPYISKQTTGSWMHKSPIHDPGHITPIIK